jgi:caffeoyl-CoA O-methyltransferase
MELKYVQLDAALNHYVCECRSDNGDVLLGKLRQETSALGAISKMEISQEQGSFLSILVASIGAKSAIEIGTFTGYSSLCIARGLGKNGKLLCLDQSEEWTSIARRYWTEDQVDKRIQLRIGPAIDELKRLEAGLTFDFAFIDAEKTEYDAYYELLLPHMRSNGLILFDNMLWGGRLGKGRIEEPSGKAIDALNKKLAKDRRVEAVLLPFADGIQMCRKL